MNINSILKTGISIFMSLSLCLSSAYGLPQVDEIVSGEASIEYTDSTMTIDATNDTIINYTSFDILANETVTITLPSVDSMILNRVLGNDISDILGNLSSNGYFILVNPSGINIGPGANIDAAGVIFSTRDIADSDFLDGEYLFKKLSEEELGRLLLNEGTITIKKGGFGVFIAGAVENRGIITAPLGKIVLAGADAVKLDISGDGLISVAIEEEVASGILDFDGNPITDQLKNSGTIEANGGTVILDAESLPDIFEKAINLEGITRATALEETDGEIRLVADNIHFSSDAILEADETILEGESPTHLWGDATFHNFVCNVPGKEIYFEAGKTYTFKGDNTYIGLDHADWPVYLKSSEQGKPWYINVEGDDYLFTVISVEDSYNIGDAIISAHPARNEGGNFYWDLNTVVWTGTTDSNWSTATNWNPNGDPTNQDVEFTGGAVASIIDQTFSILDMTINGYTGVITQSGNLTIIGDYAQATGTFTSNTSNTFSASNSFVITGGTFTRFTGAGTGISPYLIYDVYGLQGMLSDLTATYGLANNIDASSTSTWNSAAGFVPVGTMGNTFIGTFDGNGNTINDLFIDRSTTDYVGLFGWLSGTASDVGVVDADMTGQDYVGGIAGSNRGTVTDCYSTGNIAGTDDDVGGLVGLNDRATIINSYSTAAVSGNDSIGGLVGRSDGGAVTATIQGSYATGNITGIGGTFRGGGLVGWNRNDSSITDSYSTGNIDGSQLIGGFVGLNNDSTITNCFSSGKPTGGANIGGFIGSTNSSTYSENFWDTTISSQSSSAGEAVDEIEGKTTSQMQSQSTFSGWDFDDTWSIQEGSTTPYLQWEGRTFDTGETPDEIPETPDLPEPTIDEPPIDDGGGDDDGDNDIDMDGVINLEGSIGYEEGKKKYKKSYGSGRYRTVVIVFEGKVVMAPYDEDGPKYDKGIILTEGQNSSAKHTIN